jgi:hypothetical protein
VDNEVCEFSRLNIQTAAAATGGTTGAGVEIVGLALAGAASLTSTVRIGVPKPNLWRPFEKWITGMCRSENSWEVVKEVSRCRVVSR